MELSAPPPQNEIERFENVLKSRLERACSIDELLGYLTLMLFYAEYKLSENKCFSLKEASQHIALWYNREQLTGLYALGVEIIDRLGDTLFPTLGMMVVPGGQNHIVEHAVSLSNEIDVEATYLYKSHFTITGRNGFVKGG